MISILLWFCALGCALLGGVYFAFSVFIMKALEQAGTAGIVAMKSINAVILRSWFMPLFFTTTLASAILGVIGFLEIPEPLGIYLAAGGIIYFAGMFLVTVLFNVPLNNALAAAGEENWVRYLSRWTTWNHVRTVSCVVAAALFILALNRARVASPVPVF
jgi:uncharacterized membrane protein